MNQIMSATEARQQYNFSSSLNKYIEIFNDKIHEASTVDIVCYATFEHPYAMTNEQWELFIKMIEEAGYRVVQIRENEIGVYW